MDGSKLGALGWAPAMPFEEGLAATVEWYRDNPEWVAAAKGGDWAGYYERQYGSRLAHSTAADESPVEAG
jgi:dTDP-glucose 4,6-dehydratase